MCACARAKERPRLSLRMPRLLIAYHWQSDASVVGQREGKKGAHDVKTGYLCHFNEIQWVSIIKTG